MNITTILTVHLRRNIHVLITYHAYIYVKYVVQKNFQQYQAKSFYTGINKDHILVALENDLRPRI